MVHEKSRYGRKGEQRKGKAVEPAVILSKTCGGDMVGREGFKNGLAQLGTGKKASVIPLRLKAEYRASIKEKRLTLFRGTKKTTAKRT